MNAGLAASWKEMLTIAVQQAAGSDSSTYPTHMDNAFVPASDEDDALTDSVAGFLRDRQLIADAEQQTAASVSSPSPTQVQSHDVLYLFADFLVYRQKIAAHQTAESIAAESMAAESMAAESIMAPTQVDRVGTGLAAALGAQLAMEDLARNQTASSPLISDEAAARVWTAVDASIENNRNEMDEMQVDARGDGLEESDDDSLICLGMYPEPVEVVVVVEIESADDVPAPMDVDVIEPALRKPVCIRFMSICIL